MRSSLLLVLLGVSGLASAQQWVEIEPGRSVDVGSIRSTSSYVESWWLGDIHDWKPGDKERSFRSQWRFKCSERLAAPTAFLGYSQRGGAGAVVTSEYVDYPRFTPVAPGTSCADWLDFVCAYVAKEGWALRVAEAGSVAKALELASRNIQANAEAAIDAADAAAASADAAQTAMDAMDLEEAEKAAGIGSRYRTPEAIADAGVTVSAVTLGSSVDASQRISVPRVVFRPGDKIYASVSTSCDRPGQSVVATLSATWWYEPTNQLVHTERSTLAFEDDGATAFSIYKPDGWPLGAYRVEIGLDKKVVQTIRFQVRP